MLKSYLSLSVLLLSSLLGFAQTQIQYEIRNARPVGNHFVFDLHMMADQAATYMTRGQIYVHYNTQAFGDRIAHNGLVSVDTYGLLADQVPQSNVAKYSILNVADNGNDILAITWEANLLAMPVSAQTLTETPIAFNRVLEVRLPQLPAGSQAQLNLVPELMRGQQFYKTIGQSIEVAYGTGAQSLPVSLLGFDAQFMGESVRLDWTTSREVNNDHFQVEKSVNGEAFTYIGQVKGMGNSEEPQSYTFDDKDIQNGTLIYRLKQVDIDGSYAYSNEAEVRISEEASISVYPVPAKNMLYVDLPEASASAQCSIFDANGKLIKSYSFTDAGAKLSMDVSALVEGSYVIQVQSASVQASRTFTKVD